MSILPESVYQMQLPHMHRVLQLFDEQKLSDVAGAVRAELSKKEIRMLVKSGMKVALAVGSRGICNMDLIVRTVGGSPKS